MASLSTYLSLLSSSLSLVFLPLLPWRLCELNKQKIKVKPGGWRGFFKLVSVVLLASVQVLVAFLTTSYSQPSDAYVLVTGLPPIAAFGLVFLSFTEHRRSTRPSSLILVYVLASLLCDLIQLTVPSLWSLADSRRLGLTLQLTAKAIVLCAESLGKGPDLFGEWRGRSPEETASIFDRSLMWWMNTILARGYRNTLINDELPEIDHALSSLVLRERILRVWSSQSNSPWLPSVLVKCLLRPGLVVAVSRASLIVFRYAQPVLISYAIAFLNNPNSTKDDGYFVVVAAIVVHIGIAFNSRAYQQGISRLRVMVRGSLVGLVHENSLMAPSEANESGTPVALVTTDVATLENAVETFYTTWACSIEAIIGTFLLAKQVGWIWPVPHLITVFCSRISAYVARNLKHRVREWNAATRKRVSMTASVLSSAKTIKMLGMQQAVEQQLLDLRREEMDKAARVRWVRVIYNASANALGLFAPVITIVLYAIVAALKGTSLDPETAFPAVATISLVTHGANMVMTIIPKAIAAYPSFERIQSYLQPAGLGNRVLSFVPRSHDVQFAILIKDLKVSWKSGQKALSGISLGVSKGTIVACSGPVGSGKTTLARVILGETFPSLSGLVKVSANRLAYCAQTSWLPNRTVREVIHGPNIESTPDESWYRTVVNACCLDQDLAILPGGDGTLVGDGGMNLSGGQRQRVALARAVFQRCEVAVLDDIFSALDGRTEKHVAENLFGAQGLFRKLGTTIFWITSSTQHFHMADYVVVLDAGRIQEQGPWSELKASEQQISKLIHENDNNALPLESSKMKPLPAPIATEETRRGDGDSSLYRYYFASAGIRNIAFLVFCTASSGLFVTLPQYWLKFWTLDSGGHTALYATGYALLYLIAWLSTNGNMWSTLLWIAPTSSIVFHRRLLKTVLCAPLVYFSTTDTGIILNHFSQDLDLVDRYIASAFASFSTQVFKVIFQISVIFAVQPVMSLTLPVCFAVIYVVQRVYLRTSRQMRIVELESRSAVFSSLLETARGVETIRAFGWQHEMAVENMHVLDLSQRPFYLLFCLTRWLGVVLNLLGGGIAVGIILLAVVLKGTTTGAQVGVALNVILVTKTTLINLVDYYTTLEISLGAVTRLKKVDKDTPQERDESIEKLVDDSWPTSGRLEMKSLSASYNQGSLALLNVSVKIAAGETVAVCGRTGSGKSSLILSLLRLLNVESGSIIVDGVDISSVSLAVLRQRCFVTIAQDPFFLHAASLRFNLDPSSLLSNQELVRILEKVGLWTHLVNSTNSIQRQESTSSSQGKTNGHDDQTPLLATNNKSYDIDADAIFNRPFSSLPTLSGGQAQLLALARGIAQCQHPLIPSHHSHINEQYEHNPNPKPIILLDEITSSLDAVTEATVCDIVQEEFVNKGHTVVMVTHKLGPFLAARKRIIEAVEEEPGSRCGKGLTVVWMKDGRVENVERDVQTIGV